MVGMFKSVVLALGLLSTHFLEQSLGCITPRASNNTGSYPSLELGSDVPSDPATTGYSINHFAINTRNLTASVDFYIQVLGLRKLFTLQVSKHYSITYLGHSHGGKNGTGYQTNEELNREKNNAQGMIEILYVDVPVNNVSATTATPNTFAHVGMIVPDIQATQTRIDSFPDVQVLKRFGEPIEFGTVISGGSSLSDEVLAQLDEDERKIIAASVEAINYPMIVVADPDGNMVEIQPQETLEE